MSEESRFCQPIRNDEVGPGHLDWTGNDSSGRNNHNAVLLAKGSVDLKLCWKESKSSQVKFIGCYRLGLAGLVREKLIRFDSKPGYVRIRMFHAPDNNIYMQAKLRSPRNPLGRFI
jgi:hypothetical protein